MTLIEVMVAVGVLAVAFMSFYGLFQASVRFVATAKAREGAVSLAVERMESLRALPYASLGTVNGIPAGTIAQNETIQLNGISYNRRTLIQYVDDPADGTGASDANGVTADYKRAKAEVSWATPTATSSVAVISNFIPVGIENLSGGGTLSIFVLDAAGMALPNAAVRVTHSAVDVTTYSNAAGVVQFPGTPAGTGYHITASKSGYSSAQTYPASAENPNPNPGDLSVVASQTTSVSFQIDRLASLFLRTFEPGVDATTTVTFTDESGIAVMNGTEVSGNALRLANGFTTGTAYMTPIAPGQFGLWRVLSWQENEPTNTEIRLRLYTVSGGVYTLVPDSALPGNAAGFTQSPVNIGSIPAWNYPELSLGATLSTSQTTSPKLFDWTLTYTIGSQPLPNAPFTMRGSKTIGTTNAGVSIYKVDQALTTNSSGSYSSASVEWDSYSFSADGILWDLSSSCPLQPLSIAPAGSVSVDLYYWPHTSNSLRVAVVSAASSTAISGATVTVVRTGTNKTKQTDACGQSFFPGLAAASDYAVTVSAAGFTSTTTPNVVVSGQSTATISL